MSLASALNTTKNIFSNTATQTGVLSTNIQNTSNSDYNRRIAKTTTNLYSGATTVTIERSENAALLKQTLSASSSDAGQQALLAGLTSLNASMGGDDYTAAPSAALSTFRDALQSYAASPSDTTLASAAVNAAQNAATSLNTASSNVQSLREQSDSDIATDVSSLNNLLSQFKDANDKVKASTAAGAVDNDALDTRSGLLKQISQIIGVTTVTRDNNDLAIYTSDGTTLFETTPRAVTFDATKTYAADSVGNGVYIDGVAVKAGSGSDTTAQGSLQASLQLRDEVYPTYQSQLDEIARGLMSSFSETSGGGSVAGLFTTVDGTTVDYDTASVIPGLSSLITVNSAAVDDPSKLRDGSIAGDSTNTEDASGYSDLLNKYVDGFQDQMDFDQSAGIGTGVTLLNYASDSVGWVEDYRSGASDASETTSAMLSRSQDAYSNATGVNLDEELTLLLDVEQSYKAASKLLSTVDDMLKTLMDAAS